MEFSSLANKILKFCCLDRLFLKYFGPTNIEFSEVCVNNSAINQPISSDPVETDWSKFTVELPAKMSDGWFWHEIIGIPDSKDTVYISAESKTQRKLSIWYGSPFVSPSWKFLVQFSTNEFVADFSAKLSVDSNFIFCIGTAHHHEQFEYSFYLYDIKQHHYHMWKLDHHSCQPLTDCNVSLKYKFSSVENPGGSVSFYSNKKAEQLLITNYDVTEQSRSAVSNTQLFLIPDIKVQKLCMWSLEKNQFDWIEFEPESENTLVSGYFDLVAYQDLLFVVELKPPNEQCRAVISKVIFGEISYSLEVLASLNKNQNSWVLSGQKQVRETEVFKGDKFDVNCIDLKGIDGQKKLYLSTVSHIATLKQLATITVQKLFSEESCFKYSRKEFIVWKGGISDEEFKEKFGYQKENPFA